MMAIITDVKCGVCGWQMMPNYPYKHEVEGVTRFSLVLIDCTNNSCPEFGIKYLAPSIEIFRYLPVVNSKQP